MNDATMFADGSPLHVTASSVWEGYGRLLLYFLSHSGTEIAPLVLTISGPIEDVDPNDGNDVRREMDALLASKGRIDVEDVAFTIFPQRFWTMAGGDRSKLCDFYRMAFPAFKAMNRRANRRGLYFERLTMYGSGPCGGNQLEWILRQFGGRRGVRRSMLQATTFDPARDHDATAQLPFPCLQHVSFVPTADGLVVNAFYATQQVFDKAYGNYLGLARLGAFMAHEMQMPLAKLNVFVGVAKLERIGKTDPGLRSLVTAIREALDAKESVASTPRTVTERLVPA